MKQAPHYHPSESFLRVATACPDVAVGNVAVNIERIGELYAQAAAQSISLVVFPELSLTGYTLGDLIQHRTILDAARAGLIHLAKRTVSTNTAMVVGLPLVMNNDLYNCAAVLSSGKVQGIVPKTTLPNYKEFYEKRWFHSWTSQNQEILIGSERVPFGTELLFNIGEALLGIEICEDLWAVRPPSEQLARTGATIIANPSASPEQIAKSAYRRQLVTGQSGRLRAAYLYAGCDASESTTDIVMSGHQIIAENGLVLAERLPLTIDQRLITADIDLDHLQNDRRMDTNYTTDGAMPIIDCHIAAQQNDLRRQLDALPFVPTGQQAAQVLQSAFDIQAQALATRLRNTDRKKIVLGLSGGLDSTLALLVAVQAATRLRVPAKDIVHILTMPATASSKRTQQNAIRLAQALSLPSEVIPITQLCDGQLKALGHDGSTQDITYENVQARMRTSLLFNRANQLHGLVLGTGDLSEIALGWSTFNGDHMSHYNVNASIPKTLVKHLVAHALALPAFAATKDILRAILATPISPELTRSKKTGISQETEVLIGPYQLHDFFLYHFVRWNERPEKIAYLAGIAFKDSYSVAEITRWLDVFLDRFIRSQWKRSVAADGPKVGSVSLSPRGDWRAPSDITSVSWRSTLQ